MSVAYEKKISWFFLLVLLVMLTWLLPPPGLAQEETVLSNGKEEFLGYCASCHGVSGAGNGPMAGILTTKPADLTQLRKKHDGQFPFWRVYRIIDGREEVMAHGVRHMPVWGTHFLLEEGGGPATGERVIGRILGLVYYLQSIQQK